MESRIRKGHVFVAIVMIAALFFGGLFLQRRPLSADKKKPAPARPLTARSFRQKMSRRSKKLTGNFDLSIYDVTTKKTWAYSRWQGPKDRYLASIAKVPILCQLLIEQHSDGAGMTARETGLIQDMIRYSDDDSANALITGYLGTWSAVQSDFNDFGMGSSRAGSSVTGWGYGTTSATDQLRLLKNLFVSSNILDSSQRAYVTSQMAQVTRSQRWGVSQFAPGDTAAVALKNGWGIPDSDGGLVVNSIGQVTLKNGHRYLIVMLGDRFSTVKTGIAHEQSVIRAAGKLLVK